MAEWGDKMGFPGTGFSFLGLQKAKSLLTHRFVVIWLPTGNYFWILDENNTYIKPHC